MRCIGVVLAGGLSSRMGQDKALLSFEGGNLLQRTTQLLQSYCDEVWISGREVEGAYCVFDHYSQRGPVGAIHAVCEHALALDKSNASLLIVPVDLPRLDGSVLDILMHDPHKYCHFAQHPLPAKISHTDEVFAAARDMLTFSHGPVSVRTLWKRLMAHELALSNTVAAQLLNVNTPEQWAQVQLNPHNMI